MMDNQGYVQHCSEAPTAVNKTEVPEVASPPRVTPTPKTTDDHLVLHDPETEVAEPRPMALCRFIVQRYKLAFGVTVGLHLLVVLITAACMAGGVDVFNLNFNGVPLDLLDHPSFLRVLAWQNRDEDGSVLGKDTDSAAIGQRSREADHLLLYYSLGDGGTVFTAQRLREMQKVESSLLSVPDYQRFCQLPAEGSGCRLPLSILRFFDGSYGPLFNDTSFADVTGTLYRASLEPQLNQILQFHLARDGEVGSTEARSSVTRTILFLGYPLQGYDLRADNRSEQLLKIRAFQVDHFQTILQDTMEAGVGDMDFLFYSLQLVTDALLKQVIYDMLLAAGSMLFIYIFMLLMTGSLFVTTFGIFSILSSFLTTNLIYRFVCQFKYFGIFHVLSIFIILGIGADNIFVFVDTWRYTSHLTFPSLEARLSACYRKAASATLYTSLTTTAAFFSNALSPLLAIHSFGLFSGMLVMVNYLSAILFFPTVIVIYHHHFHHWQWPCFRSCKRSHRGTTGKKRHHPIVRFFRGPCHSFLTHPVLRFVLLAACAGLVVLFSVFAAQIEPDEQSVQYYQDGHPYTRAANLYKHGFKPSSQDEVIEVYVVWGLHDQDMARCDKSDITCTGDTRWDQGFDLNPKRAQSALLDFCGRIRNLTSEEADQLRIRRDKVTGQLEVLCFVERMDAYLQVESGKPQYPGGTDLSLPATEAKVDTLVVSNPSVYNLTTVSPLLYRYFETMMGYWLYDNYSRQPGYHDYKVYSQLLGEATDIFDTKPVAANPEYYWATKLQYAAVVVNTTLIAGTLSYSTGLPIVDRWDDFIQTQKSHMPTPLAGMFQCTPNQGNPWHFFYVQKELVDTAITGIVVGISLAFLVITLATRNIITGLLATLNIGVVTLSVVGLIPMAGWKLGVLESLNLSLVVGLAVDYVVHLAEGYHSSPAPDRLTRSRDMLEHVGISILSGALSTSGAAVFMFAAVILFFLQFGIFIFATIGFSMLYSLLLFSVLMALLGPQGETGSLVHLVGWVRLRLRGKTSHHVVCDTCQGRGFHGLDTTQRAPSFTNVVRP